MLRQWHGAQLSSDGLFGADQMTIGSRSSVRGFDKTSISGDRGFYWRNDVALSKSLNIADEAIAARFYAGVDVGYVEGATSGSRSGELSGLTLGFGAQWKKLNLDFSVSGPLTMPSRFDRESPRAWLSLTMDMGP